MLSTEIEVDSLPEKGIEKPQEENNWQDELNPPPKKRFWSGWDGALVTLFGILLPIFLIALNVMTLPKRLTLVLLNHPVETIIELCLILAIPFVNKAVWSAFCKNDFRFSTLKELSLGMTIGTAAIVSVICLAALFVGKLPSSDNTDVFSIGFTWMALLTLMIGGTSFYLANRIRLSRDFAKSRFRVVVVTTAGALISALLFIGAEARPWLVRIAEQKAVSNSETDQKEGLALLKTLHPERELLMECSDQKAAGLCGLFIPLKASDQHQLYFAIVGKPHTFKDINNQDLSSMPDDYHTRHVVGESIPGLSLTRSLLTGNLHPNTMTSQLDWTFVFKNKSQSDQEIRTELGLPPGAVITGLTIWNRGEPEQANFAATGKASRFVTSNILMGHESSGEVTDLGHGRMLIHCYPVKEGEELKVKATMVLPLKANGIQAANLELPRLIAQNFDIGKDNEIRLRSNKALSSVSPALKVDHFAKTSNALYGTLTKEQIATANVQVTAKRDASDLPFAAEDKIATIFAKEEAIELAKMKRKTAGTVSFPRLDHEAVAISINGTRSIQQQFTELDNAVTQRYERAKARAAALAKSQQKVPTVKTRYIVESLVKTTSPAPKNLVVVVDGSKTIGDEKQKVITALRAIPKDIPSRVIIASSSERSMQPLTVAEGIKAIGQEKFDGGEDNLHAVVKASELAGETKDGAVLWIHGPQTTLNQEIYITAPYVATPSFYEMSIGAGDADSFDYFRNHTEVGPFSQVPRGSTSTDTDLVSFLSKWRADESSVEARYQLQEQKPERFAVPSADEASELLVLQANERITGLLKDRHFRTAAREAVAYGIVSPVSTAIITKNSDAQKENEEFNNTNTSSQLAIRDKVLMQNSVPGMAPTLQGATNGTINPDGDGTTYVTGINTAGTVRVNNLANLEASLNILSNLVEGILAIAGLAFLAQAMFSQSTNMVILGQSLMVDRTQKAFIGGMLLLIGLSLPGLVNWFVASARDANLFS